jgi:hypothetical protein
VTSQPARDLGTLPSKHTEDRIDPGHAWATADPPVTQSATRPNTRSPVPGRYRGRLRRRTDCKVPSTMG